MPALAEPRSRPWSPSGAQAIESAGARRRSSDGAVPSARASGSSTKLRLASLSGPGPGPPARPRTRRQCVTFKVIMIIESDSESRHVHGHHIIESCPGMIHDSDSDSAGVTVPGNSPPAARPAAGGASPSH